MKLTICQFRKLFLLWTAFCYYIINQHHYHRSHYMAVAAIQTATNITNTTITMPEGKDNTTIDISGKAKRQQQQQESVVELEISAVQLINDTKNKELLLMKIINRDLNESKERQNLYAGNFHSPKIETTQTSNATELMEMGETLTGNSEVIVKNLTTSSQMTLEGNIKEKQQQQQYIQKTIKQNAQQLLKLQNNTKILSDSVITTTTTGTTSILIKNATPSNQRTTDSFTVDAALSMKPRIKIKLQPLTITMNDSKSPPLSIIYPTMQYPPLASNNGENNNNNDNKSGSGDNGGGGGGGVGAVDNGHLRHSRFAYFTTPITNKTTIITLQNNSHQHVGVLLPTVFPHGTLVQQGFYNFVEFFQVNLTNITVDFLSDDDDDGGATAGLSTFMKLLENSYYTMVVKILNSDFNAEIVQDVHDADNNERYNNHNNNNNRNHDEDVEVDLRKGVLPSNNKNKKLYDQTYKQPKTSYKTFHEKFNSQRYRKQQQYTYIGYCNLEAELARDYNKTVLLWPCPHMKDPGNFLPSFEAISFAVQSIVNKLNWTQVGIYVGDENWALPMAIAANLQIPYTVVIGYDGNLRDVHFKDTVGNAIILTAPMNHRSTLQAFDKWQSLLHTKILLIDIVATSFNANNHFYKRLSRLPHKSTIIPNLLLLTALSDNYRHYLHEATADDRDDIKLMQNFRQSKRQGMHHDNTYDWPIYLDTKALQRLTNYTQGTTDRVQSAIMKTLPNSNRWWSECFFLMKNNTQQLCDNPKFIIESCWHQLRTLSYKQHISLSQLQDELHAWLQQPNNCQPLRHKLNKQHLVESLQEFIDFFNFFDFLTANILSSLQQQPVETAKAVPSYDFIVLDIIFNNSEDESFSKASIPAHKRDLFKWRPLLILEQHEINLNTYISHSIQPGFDEWLLVTSAQLWHCNSICWLMIAICASILLIIVAASIAVGIALRNYYLRKRLSKGPNKIVLSASDFVFPVDSRRVDEGIEAMLCCWLQQLQEFGGPEVDKPDLLKGSIGSLKNLGFIIPGMNSTTAPGAEIGSKKQVGVNKLARHNPALLDMRARYNGDLVQLKEISLNSSGEVKSKAMDLLIVAHGLRHENINPFLGWLADANRTAMVFDYCSRGSLQDVLIMDEIKLDWSFRLSLLTDLVRGMRYLHNSPLRVHGTLTSRNCVVDARWVLKITDYGLPLFYEAQGITAPQRTAKELLWTAPELLRTMKIQQISTATHNPTQQHSYYSLHHYNKLMATQSGDVYSFGIIMQEVVVRGEPYCMLSLSAEEIIMKIKKPPPLIRPSVSKGAAPPEAINIMRQCWAEQPDMRPDFNSVYERFKLLNHGRKVNFVDTMFQLLEKYSNNLEELIRERTEQLDIERKKTEQLLNRMLPSSVAEKLKMGLAVEPEEFSDVTIYFSDIVGFTTIAAHCTPVQVVDLLNDLYTIFDATINAYNVYKVETIGDAYMVVSGLPVRIPDHAEQIATMALDLLHQSGRFHVKHLPGVPVQLRIGLHTGPCCAGVVGLTMPRYCLFGDTVNTASRMESTGSSWRIHLSQETRNRLDARGGYVIEPRGPIDIKGKGMMNTFWLLGKKDFDKPLPHPPPIGLDELFIRNSITLKSQTNRSRNSTNPSSSQSSSLAGEAVEVKVEITPPTTNAEIPNSYSLDNNSISTISPNVNLCAADFPSKTPSSTSPQSQKMSDNITSATLAENLLNPAANFTRLPNSTGGSSTRLYRKVEEMMDLSSPYNHYKCLSPSESNLTQFYDGKYIYSKGSVRISMGNILSSTPVTGLVSTLHGLNRFEKPGSTRLLRRQYSLDRDDPHRMRRELHHQHHVQMQHQYLKTSHTVGLSSKSSMLEVPLLQESARTPKIAIAKIHKQNSTSIAQDLEKIEEIPLSPVSSIQQHSSLDSTINKSPPPIIETVTPTLCQLKKQSQPSGTMILLSAPTSPAPSRSLNGFDYRAGVTESLITDTSTATTTASVQDEQYDNQMEVIKTELTLNVDGLLSRRWLEKLSIEGGFRSSRNIEIVD